VKRYRLKLSLPGKAAAIAKVFPNAFTFVAWSHPDTMEKVEFAEIVLAQFGVGLVVEEA